MKYAIIVIDADGATYILGPYSSESRARRDADAIHSEDKSVGGTGMTRPYGVTAECMFSIGKHMHSNPRTDRREANRHAPSQPDYRTT